MLQQKSGSTASTATSSSSTPSSPDRNNVHRRHPRCATTNGDNNSRYINAGIEITSSAEQQDDDHDEHGNPFIDVHLGSGAADNTMNGGAVHGQGIHSPGRRRRQEGRRRKLNKKNKKNVLFNIMRRRFTSISATILNNQIRLIACLSFALLPSTIFFLTISNNNNNSYSSSWPILLHHSNRSTSAVVEVVIPSLRSSYGSGGGGGREEASSNRPMAGVLPSVNYYSTYVKDWVVQRPSGSNNLMIKNMKRPNYGGLEMVSKASQKLFSAGRIIPDDDILVFNKKYKHYMKKMNKEAGKQRLSSTEPYRLLHYDELPFPMEGECIRPKWSFDVHPNCNIFHEITMGRAPGTYFQSFEIGFLGRGTFRQTWFLKDTQLKERPEYVLKAARYYKDEDEMDFGDYALSQIQLEAMLFSETSDGGRAFDIYGHCMTSVMVERGYPLGESIIKDRNWALIPQADIDKDQVNGVRPRNKYSPPEKLRIALAMAESLAYMHGHPKGTVAHHDVSFEQWLWDKNGRLKLNDFNKGRVLPWNLQEKEYCTFYSNQDSVYRSAEEIQGGPEDESADVVSFGGIMYTIMTGLIPYYHKKSWDEAYAAIIGGETPYIDKRYRTRSLIEGRMCELMEKCWKVKMSDRISIFEAIAHLRETARLANVSDEFLAKV